MAIGDKSIDDIIGSPIQTLDIPNYISEIIIDEIREIFKYKRIYKNRFTEVDFCSNVIRTVIEEYNSTLPPNYDIINKSTFEKLKTPIGDLFAYSKLLCENPLITAEITVNEYFLMQEFIISELLLEHKKSTNLYSKRNMIVANMSPLNGVTIP